MAKQCLHGNVRSHACDWHANYYIRRNIFLYCWNDCSSIKKFVLHSKKMFHTKKSLNFDLVFNISSQGVVLSDFDLDNNFGKYDCVTP